MTVRGAPTDLTPREFQILQALMQQPGRAFDRDLLLTVIWGEGFVGDPKTIDVYVRRLREKIEADPAHPTLIVTVWGVGYRFEQSGG